MKIIIMDFESTGLLKPIPTDVQFQPFATELQATKISYENGEFKPVDSYHTYFKPPIPIPPEITKITGIDDNTVANAPSFFQCYDELYEFFCGVDVIVGQNITYDINVLHYELMRHDLDKKFCYAKRQICTIEASYHYKNKRMKLMDLHEFLLGEKFEESHTAEGDVNATIRCFIELCKRGDIAL